MVKECDAWNQYPEHLSVLKAAKADLMGSKVDNFGELKEKAVAMQAQMGATNFILEDFCKILIAERKAKKDEEMKKKGALRYQKKTLHTLFVMLVHIVGFAIWVRRGQI